MLASELPVRFKNCLGEAVHELGKFRVGWQAPASREGVLHEQSSASRVDDDKLRTSVQIENLQRCTGCFGLIDDARGVWRDGSRQLSDPVSAGN